MLRHYVKIFFRNLGRYKLYSAINFASLVLGISFSLLVYLFVSNALPDNSFHRNFDSIYRLEGVDGGNGVRGWPMEVLEYAKEELPEVEAAYTYGHLNDLDIRVGEREFKERALHATPGFFEVLSFGLASGDARRALEQDNGVYITRKKARKLFGEDMPLGKTLEVYLGGAYHSLYVAGIVEPYPVSSSIKPDMVLPTGFVYSVRECAGSSSWACASEVILHLSPGGEESLRGRADLLAGDLNGRLSLSGPDRLTTLHLESPMNFRGDAWYENPALLAMAFLCLLILGISCVTYINNTVAATTTRFREIGIRKVMGSDRRHIALQFMAESVFSVLVALGLSLLTVELLVPMLNPHINSLIPFEFTLSTSPLYRIEVLPLLGVLAGLTALMAGAWPALVLSRFKPATVLKSGGAPGTSPSFTRYLVGIQMVVSMVIFVLALHTQNSLLAMDEDYYHYRDDGLVQVPVTEPWADGEHRSVFPTYRQQLEESGLLLPMAGLREVRVSSDNRGVRVDSREYEVHRREVTASWFEVLGMSFSERSSLLDQQVLRDSAYVVINPVLRDQIGWEDPIGRLLELDGIPHTVVGVLEAFHGFEGGEQRAPFVFRIIPESEARWAYIDTSPSPFSKAETAAKLESIREELLVEDRPLDVQTEVRFARGERVMEWIVGWSMPVVFFALGLTFLGLFSLTSFSVSRRLKELSIRKVNGAMPGELVGLLGKEYLKLGALTVIIALPLGYIASNQLVSGFARMTAPGSFFTLFALALVFLLTFILLCVGWQVWNASNVNPVKHLSEDQ